MSADHVLPNGAVKATRRDALTTVTRVGKIASEHGYSVGLTGSTLFGRLGTDIDLLVVASEDAVSTASHVASDILLGLAVTVYSFEEHDDHADHISMTFLQKGSTMVDVYVVGLPDA